MARFCHKPGSIVDVFQNFTHNDTIECFSRQRRIHEVGMDALNPRGFDFEGIEDVTSDFDRSCADIDKAD